MILSQGSVTPYNLKELYGVLMAYTVSVSSGSKGKANKQSDLPLIINSKYTPFGENLSLL
jgi:hypothetical protein